MNRATAVPTLGGRASGMPPPARVATSGTGTHLARRARAAHGRCDESLARLARWDGVVPRAGDARGWRAEGGGSRFASPMRSRPLMERRRGGRAAAATVCALALGAGLAGTAAASGPARLSLDRRPADVRSSHGSGAFGRWTADRFGLPAFRYLVDERRTPWARQPETGSHRGATRGRQRPHRRRRLQPRLHASSGARTASRSGRTAGSPAAATTRAATAGCASRAGS